MEIDCCPYCTSDNTEFLHKFPTHEMWLCKCCAGVFKVIKDEGNIPNVIRNSNPGSKGDKEVRES